MRSAGRRDTHRSTKARHLQVPGLCRSWTPLILDVVDRVPQCRV
ncbi:hypothetical protein ACFFX0_05940 [Citricoccus parietis]|uniref:Uncharacterized protein n=1 Tax=Citricoccus parietis TaxID=592307 RepID=A0ABV5FWB3_9MICC